MPHLSRRAVLVGTASVALTTAAHAAPDKPEVDLLLVLAADVSKSVDAKEFQLQREGYAQALTSPDVIDVIRAGRHRRIAVTYFEWSEYFEQHTVVDWNIIDSIETGSRFVSKMAEAPRKFHGSTAIGRAIDYGAARIYEAPYHSYRKTIDISGDGTDNVDGRPVTEARDEAVAAGIVVNGLVILSPSWSPYPHMMSRHTDPPGGLEKYYSDHVIGGDDSFVVVAKDFTSFGAAIKRKFIAEIAWR
jgi:hypothetical protein